MSKFHRQKFINQVLERTGAQDGTYALLRTMMIDLEFDRPEVTFTKPQLVKKGRCCVDTVRNAIRYLRHEGTLEAIKHPDGGRGNAVTYRVHVPVRDIDLAPIAPDQSKPQSCPEWDAISAVFKGVKPSPYAAFLEPCSVTSFDAGELVVRGPSAFIAEHCRTNWTPMLERIAADLHLDVKRIIFTA